MMFNMINVLAERLPGMPLEPGDKFYTLGKVLDFILTYGLLVGMGVCGLILTGYLVYFLVGKFHPIFKVFITGMIMTYLVCIIWYFKSYNHLMANGSDPLHASVSSLILILVPMILPMIFSCVIPPFFFGCAYFFIMIAI